MNTPDSGSYVFGDDGRGRLFIEEKGDHLRVRTYTGNWTLEDFFGACINASIAAGKPAVFRDELGVETWFHRESVVAERIQYSADQRAVHLAK
jgi:hypothetical protein